MDGIVWRTTRQTALKIHRTANTYAREREAYLRLQKRNLRKLSGFTIPLLMTVNDECLALELTIADRPFVLDFTEARLDAAFPELDDPAWIREKQRVYGQDWPDVRRLLDALLQYGIAFRDVHPGNISLRP